jgi:hypothetical protein
VNVCQWCDKLDLPVKDLASRHFTSGCVHEHIVTLPLCTGHYDQAVGATDNRALLCTECYEHDWHDCRVVQIKVDA